MKKTSMLLMLLISTLFFSGCTNRDAAQLGSLIGRSLGKPVGVVATAVDETFNTAGDVIKENPRYNHSTPHYQQSPAQHSSASNADTHYYRAEVIVKTKGPANIESLALQDTEDITEFWK